MNTMHNKKRGKLHNNDRGFTIVELMLALVGLATLLLLSTMILIQIGSLFSKGVNASNLQNTNRTVVANVSAALQFGGAGRITPPTGKNPINYGLGTREASVYVHCVGLVRYSYVLNRPLGHDDGDPPLKPVTDTHHVLWRDTLASATSPCVPLDITKADPDDPTGTSPAGNDGHELLAERMRLTKFDINGPGGPLNNIYDVAVWMAFGSSDLVVDPALPTGHWTCKGGKGTQFCSTTEINTTVAGRAY